MLRGLVDNLPLKLLSLGLAMLIWLAIAGDKSSERGLEVPVELQNVPRDLELVGEAVDVVDVRVRASPGAIQRLGPGDVSAQIDLAGAREGERIEHLGAGNIRVPFGVRVVQVTPSLLTLSFERTLHKTVPVQPRLVGRPAEGYEVATIVCQPPEVPLAGPRSRIDEAENAFTEPVSLDGARSDVVQRVNVGVADPSLRVQASPLVQVQVGIREVQETRSFAGLAVEVRGGGRARPERVTVVLSGPRNALAGLRADAVRPYVEAPEAAADRGAVELEVEVEVVPARAGLRADSIVPARVRVYRR